MMPLGGHDIALIIGTTAVCTLLLGAVSLGVLRLNRRGSISSQVLIVLGFLAVSVLVSTLAVLREMYFSGHDLTVLAWLVGCASVLGGAAAWWMIRREVRASVARLSASTRRLGRGDVVAPGPATWREFEQLSQELASTSQRLAASRAEVERLQEARSRFLAWISHDLRTPLAGIHALAESVETGSAPVGEALPLMRDRASAMAGMLDDLFELSRLETGTLPLHREPVELLDLVSDAVSDVAPLAAARGLRIVPDGIDGHLLYADARELTRAVSNLLGNAVKHAPAGSQIVVAAGRRDDEHLVISVLDHGSGVAEEDLGRIFEVGWRADDARGGTAEREAAAPQGAGLGLAIVRGIVEAHGGSVLARQVPDGFRLEMVLPTAVPA